MVVPIKLGTGPTPSLEPAALEVLFSPPPLSQDLQDCFNYDVTSDGKHFLLAIADSSSAASTALNVVLNWDKPRP